MSHLRELLNLMSNHTLGIVARNAFLDWCDMKESHSYVFLSTVIQLSLGVRVKPYIVSPLVENVVNLCFSYPGNVSHFSYPYHNSLLVSYDMACSLLQIVIVGNHRGKLACHSRFDGCESRRAK